MPQFSQNRSDNVGDSITQELLLSATIVKLKHLQVIVFNEGTAKLACNSQFTRDSKKHKITLISRLYQLP